MSVLGVGISRVAVTEVRRSGAERFKETRCLGPRLVDGTRRSCPARKCGWLFRRLRTR